MTWRITCSAGIVLAACATGAAREPQSPAATTERVPMGHTGSTEMTDTRTFGRVLGETARAAQRLHLQVLTKEGTDFESWVAFTLLADNEAIPKETLIAELARRLDIERSASETVLARLASAGHVQARVDGTTELLELTEAGKTYLLRVRGAVSQVTRRLIGHLDQKDVDTTMKVLRAVGKAASDVTETAASSP
jgi:DNA-binding MarR family transcriptional regulator